MKDHLYRNASIEVFRNAQLKMYSRVGESEDDFQERCDRAAEDRADEEIAKVRDRLETKLDRAKDQLATAHRRMQELELDTDTRKRDEWMSGASDVLGVLLGGRRNRSLSGASRRRSQTQRTQQRLRTAEAKVQDKVDEITEIEQDIVLEVEEINDKWEDIAADIDTLEVGLEKNDISRGRGGPGVGEEVSSASASAVPVQDAGHRRSSPGSALARSFPPARGSEQPAAIDRLGLGTDPLPLSLRLGATCLLTLLLRPLGD